MKRFFTALAILMFACSIYAANVNVLWQKVRSTSLGGVYDAKQSDTLGIGTGNSKTFLLDTSATPDKGLSLAGDTIGVLVTGYGDADETSSQIVIHESPNGNLTWVAVVTDTLTNAGSTTGTKVVKAKMYPNCTYKAVITTYGSTDSMSVLKVRAWGE